jgi:ADP-ribose pyrophosphatase
MIKLWKLNKTKEVFVSRPFNVLQKEYDKPDNKGPFTAYCLNLPNWVNIIGKVIEGPQKGKIILIQQYRFGTDQIELEIPGGVIDAGEAPEHAAKREMEEETGFKVKKLKQIGMVAANPAIMNNNVYTFLAEIAPSGEQHLDPDEIIEDEFATLKEIRNYLRNGKITNAYIVAAFHWLALQGEIK